MWLLLTLLLATTSHAEIKVDKKLEGEYGLRCSECVLTAHHAQYTIQDLLQRDERWDAFKWLDQMHAFCERRHPDERSMCFVFARQHGDIVARELVELVEDADGIEDSTIATPDAVAKALCAHDGLTGVCPKNAHAFRAKAAGTSTSETQIAVRNARKVGPIEVHEIDMNLVDREGCAPSELVHVGDSLADDALGALEFGARAIQVRKYDSGKERDEGEAVRRRLEAYGADRFARVDSVADVPKVIARWR